MSEIVVHRTDGEGLPVRARRGLVEPIDARVTRLLGLALGLKLALSVNWFAPQLANGRLVRVNGFRLCAASCRYLLRRSHTRNCAADVSSETQMMFLRQTRGPKQSGRSR